MSINNLMLYADHAHEHLHGEFNIFHIIGETFTDALKILPLLFVAFLVIEIIEHKAADKLRNALSSKRAGVFGGALFGLFPECGFSVAASNLYAEKLISAGTLAAVFIATSDEALPIILSVPQTAPYFFALLLLKLVLALAAGYLLDFILKLVKSHGIAKKEEHNEHTHHHDQHFHEAGEHHRCSYCDSNRGIIKNSLSRTFVTILFIILTIFLFNCIVSLIGEENIKGMMGSIKYLQPFITALLGLVPSCAVSVMLAGLFSEGAISFGALVAGLCAGAGAGVAVLFKSCKDIKKSLSIVCYVWLFSAISGVIISIFA